MHKTVSHFETMMTINQILCKESRQNSVKILYLYNVKIGEGVCDSGVVKIEKVKKFTMYSGQKKKLNGPGVANNFPPIIVRQFFLPKLYNGELRP